MYVNALIAMAVRRQDILCVEKQVRQDDVVPAKSVVSAFDLPHHDASLGC